MCVLLSFLAITWNYLLGFKFISKINWDCLSGNSTLNNNNKRTFILFIIYPNYHNNQINSYCYWASLWLSGKESACNAGDLGSIPGSGRSAWRRKWQHTPVFLPGESHGQRSLVGYSLCVTKSQTWLSN